VGQAGVIDATEALEEPVAAQRPSSAPPKRHRPRLALILSLAGAGVIVLAVAAGVAWSRHNEHHPPPTPVAVVPVSTFDPAPGAVGVRPDAKVTVQANRGRLASVRVVDGAGHELAGALTPDSRSWQSNATLAFGTRYTATARIAGVRKRAVVRTSEFSTVQPAGFLGPIVTPGDHDTVGVGAPIVITFKSPVTNRVAVTQALSVSMSKPVDGAWHWFGPHEVHYRPRDYWPVGEQLAVVAKLKNVDAGGNIWGEVDRSVNFTVGDSHISTVDTDAHSMTVTVNGTTIRTLPQSSGRDKYPTMGGLHIVLDKAQHVVMDSSTVGIPVNSPDGYKEDVYWNVAITNGGEYVHAAPWSTGAQGNRNVSHGCVNLSTSDATWFYHFSQYGDLVQVIGSSRAPTGDAGTADWNMPWEHWVQPIA
jgi:lipoprotein-anchoring transpeptidase ErfK/SrfK